MLFDKSLELNVFIYEDEDISQDYYKTKYLNMHHPAHSKCSINISCFRDDSDILSPEVKYCNPETGAIHCQED